MTFLTQPIKEHPFISGIFSSAGGWGMTAIGVLSDDTVVRVIGSIGGLMGISLTCMSIYFMFLKIKAFLRDEKNRT